MEPNICFYERPLATADSLHVVRVVDGIITNQWIQVHDGQALDISHGHPEWIGQPVKVIRGQGYKRVRGDRRAQLSSLTTEE